MKNLTSVENFGSIDALEDSILDEVFQLHPAFTDATEFKKFLILGRKGSGKSSIFQKIINEKKYDSFSLGYTFSDYPWHYHDKQSVVGMPDSEKYINSWEYLNLIALSKIILNKDNSLPYNEKSMAGMIKIEKFIVDSYGSSDPDLAQIFTPSKTLKFKGSLGVDISKVSAKIDAESVPVNYLPLIFQEVNKSLSDIIINALNPDHEYYVCYDGLDLGFDPNSPEYKNRIIGLLRAARKLNIEAREKEKKLNILVFLRTDIYDELQFEDKNKLTVNNSSRIEWSIDGLRQLMSKRFTKLLGDDLNKTVEWSDVFNEEELMRGNQRKIQHILDRTFLRPRDLIHFCNEILNNHNNNNRDEIKFSNKDINNSKNSYSAYFLREIDDELHKHIPKYKDYLEIFKAIGILQFSAEDFKTQFEETKKTFKSLPLDSDKILKDFFNFSLLGFYQAGGSGYGGSSYVFKYIKDMSQFNQSTKYKLHAGLAEVLNLKQYQRQKD